MNYIYKILFLSLVTGFVLCEDFIDSLFLVEREATCELAGRSFGEGQSHTPNNCLDVCLCEEDGKFHCQTCKPPKPTSKCNGWAHQLNKVDFHVGTKEGGGCDCFKYECHKKSLKTLFKQLWNNLKSKVKKTVHGKNSKADNVVREE